MKACVLRACEEELLVCDLCTLRELLIHTPDAMEFRPGDRVRIRNSGRVEVVKCGPQPETDRLCRVKKC